MNTDQFKKPEYEIDHNLFQELKDLGVTQEAFARAICLNVSHLSRWINKKNVPSLAYSMLISQALGKKIEDIFYLKPKQSSTNQENSCLENGDSNGD
ncbi:MAG: helix-turn-helix transcriptional regulator [Oligoflexales bacterium]|nr:helix-turn-helix transcriptional regulator [Oligoflexales bacterium]